MGRGAIVIGLAAVIIGEVLGEAIFRKHMNFIIRMVFVIVGGILYYIAMGIVLLAQDADRRYKALHGNYRCNLPCSSVSPEKEKDFIQESCKNEC